MAKPNPVHDKTALRAPRDPFRAVPVANTGIKSKQDGRGRLQLKAVAPPRPGLAGFAALKLKMRKPLRVNLDERGSAFWRRVDGRRTLREIEKALRREFSIEKKECQKAVIEFTKMLMERGLIALKMDPEKGHAKD